MTLERGEAEKESTIHPMQKNLMVLIEDVRWLLSHNDCPSYPLVLTVFAGIECIANGNDYKGTRCERAMQFIETRMEGYDRILERGIPLSQVLYNQLRSGITHHGGPRGGISVSHERSAQQYHLKVYREKDSTYFMVHTRSLARDFLLAAEKEVKELRRQPGSGSYNTEALKGRYVNVPVLAQAKPATHYPIADIALKGTSAE